MNDRMVRKLAENSDDDVDGNNHYDLASGGNYLNNDDGKPSSDKVHSA